MCFIKYLSAIPLGSLMVQTTLWSRDFSDVFFLSYSWKLVPTFGQLSNVCSILYQNPLPLETANGCSQQFSCRSVLAGVYM